MPLDKKSDICEENNCFPLSTQENMVIEQIDNFCECWNLEANCFICSLWKKKHFKEPLLEMKPKFDSYDSKFDCYDTISVIISCSWN